MSALHEGTSTTRHEHEAAGKTVASQRTYGRIYHSGSMIYFYTDRGLQRNVALSKDRPTGLIWPQSADLVWQKAHVLST